METNSVNILLLPLSIYFSLSLSLSLRRFDSRILNYTETPRPARRPTLTFVSRAYLLLVSRATKTIRRIRDESKGNVGAARSSAIDEERDSFFSRSLAVHHDVYPSYHAHPVAGVAFP